MEKSPDKDAAVKFFEKQIWGKKPIYPHCRKTNTVPHSNCNGHRCKTYRKDVTIRIGTIFENFRIKLHKWLYAMYLLVTSRKGISSMQLAIEIGVIQNTARFLLQRLREACSEESGIFEEIIDSNIKKESILSTHLSKVKRK